ncbi:MAG: M23 family metallopeptidase [Candidatus Gastranaerophilales bacterium]|nr:M23 family metallopeptidase [Candidatus Gastranaerophilales bacterium]
MNICIPFRKAIVPFAFTLGVMNPIKFGPALRTPVKDTFVKTCIVDKLSQAADMAHSMEIKNDTNFTGGITRTFSKENIEKLRQTISRPTTPTDYTAPVKNDKNVYLEPFGMFFAKRPGGRPHLGLDIFATPLAKKPKEPVVITAPVDGIVISNKKANPDNNLVANCVGLLGVDGRKYAFDHLARATDYKTSVVMPELGTVMHKGDTIGYMGATGETSLWHLHLGIETEEQLAKQQNSVMWQKISKNSPYSKLKGQVDPLNEEEAGLIARKLNEYSIQNMSSAKKMLLPYEGRNKYLNK